MRLWFFFFIIRKVWGLAAITCWRGWIHYGRTEGARGWEWRQNLGWINFSMRRKNMRILTNLNNLLMCPTGIKLTNFLININQLLRESSRGIQWTRWKRINWRIKSRLLHQFHLSINSRSKIYEARTRLGGFRTGVWCGCRRVDAAFELLFFFSRIRTDSALICADSARIRPNRVVSAGNWKGRNQPWIMSE